MNETQAIAIRNAYCSLIKIIYSMDGVYSYNSSIRELAEVGSDELLDAFPDVFSDAHESLKLTDRTYKKL